MKHWLEEIQALQKRLIRHNIPAYSAQMAYFFFLSLFPFLIVLFTVLTLFEVDLNWLRFQIGTILLPDIAHMLSAYVENVVLTQDVSLLSFSILLTLWSASRALSALVHALNQSYEVVEDRGWLQRRLMGMVHTILLSVAIAVALILPSIGRNVLEFLQDYLPISDGFIDWFTTLRWVIGVLLPLFVLSMIYMFLPNRRLGFKDVIWGTIFAFFGWLALSVGFSYFVSNFGRFSIVYGSLATVIILMIWLYMSGMVIMLGGEINSLIYEYKTQGFQKDRGQEEE